jgi:hypothetical protein
MRKYQTNKFNSYQGLKAMLDSHKSVYSDSKLAMKLVKEYLKRMDEILVVAGKSDNKTKKITKDKLKAKIAMARETDAFASAGALYALESENAELLSELDITFTKIRYAKDADALRYANNVHDILRSHQEQLGKYMVSGNDLDGLKTAIDEFQKLYKLRIEVKNDAKTNKLKLVRLFREMDDFLEEKLDRLFKRLGQDHPDASMHYFEARKIDDRGGKQRSPSGPQSMESGNGKGNKA